jgi:histidinol-phosphate aminotransferase
VDEAFIGLAGHRVHSCRRNLLVTRTFQRPAWPASGSGQVTAPISDALNNHNDAYPLARPSEAGAIATLQHEDEIHARNRQLRQWTEALAVQLRGLGVRTYPTETYFFLADFAPHDATTLAEQLKAQNILVKPLKDARLGPGYLRVTTALPEDNARFVTALKVLL